VCSLDVPSNLGRILLAVLLSHVNEVGHSNMDTIVGNVHAIALVFDVLVKIGMVPGTQVVDALVLFLSDELRD